MKTKMLYELIKSSIDDRKQIRRSLENNLIFQRCVPYAVKEVFYKLYDVTLEQNYKLLNHIAECKSDIYNTNNVVYQKYQDLDEIFIDYCFSLADFYNIKCNILF